MLGRVGRDAHCVPRGRFVWLMAPGIRRRYLPARQRLAMSLTTQGRAENIAEAGARVLRHSGGMYYLDITLEGINMTTPNPPTVQVLTVPATGNEYYLSITGSSSAWPDWIVQGSAAGNPSGIVLGYLEWAGNGTTNFMYQAINFQGTGLGGAQGLSGALAVLDAWLVSNGVDPL